MRALAAFGIATETSDFPTVLNCPKCYENTLHVFDDILTNGLWMCCTNCRAAGNIITFGAQLWKTGVKQAIKKFAELGAVSEADVATKTADCEKSAQKYEALQLFWEKADQQLWATDDDITLCKLRELGLHKETAAGVGLVGLATTEQVEALCEELGRRYVSPVRRHAPFIVYPYYDLPGRLVGARVTQYDEDFKEKSVYISTSWQAAITDAGYFLLNNLLQPVPPAFTGKQFIVESPEWALRLQCAQIRQGLPMLPVVASCTHPRARSIGHCWSALFPATRFFQSKNPQPMTVGQACLGRGYVCCAPLDTKKPKDNSSYFINRLQVIYSAAKPWARSLVDTLGELSELAGHSFISKLEIPRERLKTFLEKNQTQFSRQFRERALAEFGTHKLKTKRIFGNSDVVERNGEWQTTTGNLIANCQIRIKKVLNYDTGAVVLCGTIFIAGRQFDFVEEKDKVASRGLLKFAAHHVAQHGVLLNYARNWNNRSLLAALTLHPPEVVPVSDKLGWDARAELFRLGCFAFNTAGEVVAEHKLPQQKIVAKFLPPSAAAPQALEHLTLPSPENNSVWALFATITANAIAPLIGRDFCATLIPPDFFSLTQKMADNLGAVHLETSAIKRNTAAAFMRYSARNKTWPTTLFNTFDDTLFTCGIHSYHAEPLLVKMTADATAVAASYGWQALRGGAFRGTPADYTWARELFTLYVQHVLRNRMRLGLPQENITVSVLADLHQWLEKTYGKTFTLPAVRQQLITPAEAHTELLSQLADAIRAEDIDVLPRPRKPTQPYNYLIRRKTTWWLNQKAINAYLTARKVIAPNWLQVIDLLNNSGALVGEEELNKITGLVVRSEWCDELLLPPIAAANNQPKLCG